MTAVGENVRGQKSRIAGPTPHFNNKLFRGSVRTATRITFVGDDYFPHEGFDTGGQYAAPIQGICAVGHHDAATARLVPS